MKSKSFFHSVYYALRGLVYTFKTERNIKIYVLFYFFFLAVNLITKVDNLAYITQIITALGAFSAECTNTAIEHVCNKLTKEIDPEIRIIKDIAAAAVCCWGFAYFGLELFFIGKAIIC